MTKENSYQDHPQKVNETHQINHAIYSAYLQTPTATALNPRVSIYITTIYTVSTATTNVPRVASLQPAIWMDSCSFPNTEYLGVDVHLGGATAMPRSKQHTTPSTLVLHILERVHNIRDTSQAAKTAKTRAPGTIIY